MAATVDLVVAIVGAVVGAALFALGINAFKYRPFTWQQLRCLFQPRRDLRVSMSALLRVSKGGRYVLVRNVRRPSHFGPIGGVIKYEPGAREVLDRFPFDDEAGTVGLPVDRDLRGFIPAIKIWAFRRWFNSKKNRELNGLEREIREELGHIGLESLTRNVRDLRFREAWTFEEGPGPVHEKPYLGYRLHEICDFETANKRGENLTERLFEAARKSQDLLIATREEILAGRSGDGREIAPHAIYLLGRRPRY